MTHNPKEEEYANYLLNEQCLLCSVVLEPTCQEKTSLSTQRFRSVDHLKPPLFKARFKRRILHAPNAIQTMHNEEAYLIIYCLNCIRCMQNSTFETGLTSFDDDCAIFIFISAADKLMSCHFNLKVQEHYGAKHNNDVPHAGRLGWHNCFRRECIRSTSPICCLRALKLFSILFRFRLPLQGHGNLKT